MSRRINRIGIASILITSLAYGSSYAEDRERLMPTTAVSKVSVSKRQDGLALYLTVKNDSTMVVTNVEFTCVVRDLKKPRPAKASNGQDWCTGDDVVMAGSTPMMIKKCAFDSSLKYQSAEAISPGKSKDFYFEMGRDWPKIYQCVASEVRGREAKFWER